MKNTAFQYFERIGQPIIARATAKGGPVEVLRISGKNLDFLEKFFKKKLPANKEFHVSELIDQNGNSIEKALVLNFVEPQSFTGENVIEIQCHGISSVVGEIIKTAISFGVIEALPGEFSFRAVINNKMSLMEAESLNYVLSNEDLPLEEATALIGFSKKNENKAVEFFSKLKSELAIVRARIEASIDFSEAEEEQKEYVIEAKNLLENVVLSLTPLLNAYSNFSKVAANPRVVLVGATNVGKSTLMNIMCGGDKAIVSKTAGTTRDVVEAKISLPEGATILLQDTAGLRNLQSFQVDEHLDLEKQGMQKTMDAVELADCVVYVDSLEDHLSGRELYSQLRDKISLCIFSHADLCQSTDSRAFNLSDSQEEAAVRKYIYRGIEESVSGNRDNFPDEIFFLNKRQVDLVGQISQKLLLAKLNFEKYPIEVLGEELKAIELLASKVLGEDLSEDYLCNIFSQFCLGK